MVDPAVGVRPTISGAYDRGSAADIWMKEPNGTDHLGSKPNFSCSNWSPDSFPLVVWPGVVVWPDWFHPSAQSFWNKEFELFFNPTNGIDIDGVWIDMNEPASFCIYPCDDPYEQARRRNLPPPRKGSSPSDDALHKVKDEKKTEKGQKGRDVGMLNPPYAIGNALPYISDRTAHTDVVHANGLLEYDTRTYLIYGKRASNIEVEHRQPLRHDDGWCNP
jgi:alpha-glucosidase